MFKINHKVLKKFSQKATEIPNSMGMGHVPKILEKNRWLLSGIFFYF